MANALSNPDPQSCTTWARHRRHLSINLRYDSTVGQGGHALCGQAVVDQDRLDHYFPEPPAGVRRRRRVIAELPLCRWCDRIRDRRYPPDPPNS